MKVLSIHLTDVCNAKCTFCVVGVPEIKKDTINRKRIDNLLMINSGKGFDAVNLHGGEPTLQPGFLDTLELIKSFGYPKVILQTNARRLSDKGFVEKLAALNVKQFVISLHGPDQALHDGVTRTPGSFRSVVAAIPNCKSFGARVHTNTVLLRANIAQMTDIADLALDLGADHINISNLHPTMTAFRNFQELTPSAAESLEWVAKAVEHIHHRGAPVTLEGFPHCLTPGLSEYHLRRVEERWMMEIRGNWLPDYEKFMDDVCRVKGEICSTCAMKDTCGGVYREYIQMRGWSEFTPIVVEPNRVDAPYGRD